MQINTPKLDPSFIGFITTGNFIFELLIFSIILNFSSFEYIIYLGVNIFFSIKINFDNSLSMAILEGKTPE